MLSASLPPALAILQSQFQVIRACSGWIVQVSMKQQVKGVINIEVGTSTLKNLHHHVSHKHPGKHAIIHSYSCFTATSSVRTSS